MVLCLEIFVLPPLQNDEYVTFYHYFLSFCCSSLVLDSALEFSVNFLSVLRDTTQVRLSVLWKTAHSSRVCVSLKSVRGRGLG